MGITGLSQENRTRVFFFLILFAAVLWAVFLLQRGEIFQLSILVASLAAINPVVGLIEVRNPRKARSLFFLYLLILVGLLWATFLIVLGVQPLDQPLPHHRCHRDTRNPQDDYP